MAFAKEPRSVCYLPGPRVWAERHVRSAICLARFQLVLECAPPSGRVLSAWRARGKGGPARPALPYLIWPRPPGLAAPPRPPPGQRAICLVRPRVGGGFLGGGGGGRGGGR
eukprot:4874661-Pyramimonas_sp.AAC.1